jgi:ABC-2 type transport system permease protein
MSRAPVIARRELSSFFYSPIAYVAMFLFLGVAAYTFAIRDFQPGQPVGLRGVFDWMVWLLVFVLPVLCMGQLAQEWASGTIETMMTAPVNETDLVVGKFIGSFVFFLLLLLPTLLFVVILRIYGRPDFGPIVSGYLGLVLVGALFVAIGLFCSSVTKSQVVAAVASAAILAVVTLLPYYASGNAALPTFWRRVTDQGVFARYADFSKGVIDTGNLIYFLAITGVFLFLTVKVMEARRWK